MSRGREEPRVKGERQERSTRVPTVCSIYFALSDPSSHYHNQPNLEYTFTDFLSSIVYIIKTGVNRGGGGKPSGALQRNTGNVSHPTQVDFVLLILCILFLPPPIIPRLTRQALIQLFRQPHVVITGNLPKSHRRGMTVVGEDLRTPSFIKHPQSPTSTASNSLLYQ